MNQTERLESSSTEARITSIKNLQNLLQEISQNSETMNAKNLCQAMLVRLQEVENIIPWVVGKLELELKLFPNTALEIDKSVITLMEQFNNLTPNIRLLIRQDNAELVFILSIRYQNS
ncbi:MAG: hypothetical protein UW24_C0023G0009 [Parcubacteria group bacterium GW2011_GWA2_44_12]|nr:MAG: hypothetical protein UW24_C0023G0009 [Parcubacteria group bacterium GW2011_GWA2_44_12]